MILSADWKYLQKILPLGQNKFTLHNIPREITILYLTIVEMIGGQFVKNYEISVSDKIKN